MAKVGRKEKLDELKKGQCTALLAAGCSKAEMARQLQVSLTTIRNAMQRDPEFASAVRRAEGLRQVNQLQRIHTISDRSWRAAAWKLRTLHPLDYPHQGRGVMSRRQIGAALTRFAVTILPFIRSPDDRKAVRARLVELANDLDCRRLASRALWESEGEGRQQVAPEFEPVRKPGRPSGQAEWLCPETGHNGSEREGRPHVAPELLCDDAKK